MLSKNKIKYIRSLELKKNRKEEQVFLAEGNKLVGDLIGHFSCRLILATEQWLQNHPRLLATETIEVTHEELSRASLLKTPQEVLAIFEQPHYDFDADVASRSLCLALDDVQDPGTWERLSALPTGLVSSIYSVRTEQPTFTTPRPYRLPWEPLPGSNCITAIYQNSLETPLKRTYLFSELSSTEKTSIPSIFPKTESSSWETKATASVNRLPERSATACLSPTIRKDVKRVNR